MSGSDPKFRSVIAPAEISVHGAQSGAVKTRVLPGPLTGSTTAESMTSNSRPTMQAKIPAAMKKLFHMMSRADRGSIRQRVRGHLIEATTGSIGRAHPVAQTT